MAAADRVELDDRDSGRCCSQREVRIPEIRLRQAASCAWKPARSGVGQLGLRRTGGRHAAVPQAVDRRWPRAIHRRAATRPTSTSTSRSSARPRREDAAPPIDGRRRRALEGQRVHACTGRAESPLELRDTRRSPIASTCMPGRRHAKRMRAARCSIRCACATSICSWRCRDQNLEDLYPLIGIATPPTPPYALRRARCTPRRTGNIWHYDDFTGVVGDSDLSGDASVETGGARPLPARQPGLQAPGLRRSRRLRRQAAPQAGGRRNHQRRTAGAGRQARRRARACCPTRRTNWTSCARWTPTCAGRRSASTRPTLPIDDMDAHLILERGLLRLEPLNFGVAGGDIRSTIRMDARESPIRTRAEMQARRLRPGRTVARRGADEGCGRPHRRRHRASPAPAIRSRACSAAPTATSQLGMGQRTDQQPADGTGRHRHRRGAEIPGRQATARCRSAARSATSR